ncbi:HNH endonuclease [Latilactobacillus curvatus]|nr:HNH endonuclease [Latilactobacillus curvatus]MCS8582384.1 HNH endonuclease [Latilactobacillus curvatus]MCS8607006.1 HNH endonuclease [Latilactobacillus curvatus]MCS8617094.1 HNH endonuclease [Latilactobacillus curvatus]
MRVHRCYQIGCRELVPLNHRYCDQHYKQRHKDYVNKQSNLTESEQARRSRDSKRYDQQERNPERTAFYHSTRWIKVADYVRSRDMYSDQVTGNVVDDGASIVDHIVPMRLCALPEDKLDTTNLWLLSRRTHNIKTKLEQSMDDNKLKHLDRKWWTKVLREKM